jgi:hypothetical protein
MANKVCWKYTRNWIPIIGGGPKVYCEEPSALARSNAQFYRVPGNDYTLSRMSSTISVTVDDDDDDNDNGTWLYDDFDHAINWNSFKGGWCPDLIPGIPIEKPIEDIMVCKSAKPTGARRKAQAPWHEEEAERQRITDKVLSLLPSRCVGAEFSCSCFYHKDDHPSAILTVWEKSAGRPYVFYRCYATSCMKSNGDGSQNPLTLDEAFVGHVAAADFGCKRMGR